MRLPSSSTLLLHPPHPSPSTCQLFRLWLASCSCDCRVLVAGLNTHSHCRNRKLREEVYRAYLTRASSGEVDNTPVIDRILAARDEQAKLLGFSCFAEKSMASKVR